jgi:hypothetical protein
LNYSAAIGVTGQAPNLSFEALNATVWVSAQFSAKFIDAHGVGTVGSVGSANSTSCTSGTLRSALPTKTSSCTGRQASLDDVASIGSLQFKNIVDQRWVFGNDWKVIQIIQQSAFKDYKRLDVTGVHSSMFGDLLQTFCSFVHR